MMRLGRAQANYNSRLTPGWCSKLNDAVGQFLVEQARGSLESDQPSFLENCGGEVPFEEEVTIDLKEKAVA